MLSYDLGPGVEAFSTHCDDPLTFSVVLPEHQAHGTRSAIVPDEADAITGVDALITSMPGLRIGVKTADCVPILLYDSARRVVAVVHSGWKGTLANIIGCTIERMREAFGTAPAGLRAVIGPCIHVDAFEVGDDLHDLFAQAGYSSFMARMPRFGTADEDIKWHIDLPGICRKQLEDTGVQMIEVRPECTFSLHHRFYSARRLGKEFGDQRIINTIMLTH